MMLIKCICVHLCLWEGLCSGYMGMKPLIDELVSDYKA